MYPLTKFKVAPIALALLLTGCAVGPDYDEPQTTMAETFLYSQGDVNQDGSEPKRTAQSLVDTVQ